LVGLLPLIVFGGIALRHVSIVLKKEVLDKHLFLAQSLSYATETHIYKWLVMVDSISWEFENLDKNLFEEKLRETIGRYRSIENVVIVNSNGEIVYSFPFISIVPSWDTVGYLFFNNTEILFSKPWFSPLTREPSIWIGKRFGDKRIILALNLIDIQDLVNRTVAEAGHFCFIIDKNNLILSHAYKTRLLNKLHTEHIANLGFLSPHAEGLLLKEDNELKVAVVKTIKPFQWKAIAWSSVKSSFSETYFLLKISLGGLIVALIFAVLLSIYLSKRISNPISLLQKGTEGIARGNYDILEFKKSYQEIDELSDKVRFMAEALKAREQEMLVEQEKFRNLYEESKRREELYQSLLNASPDPIVIYDLEGNVQYINEAFEKTFGWSFEELKGKRVPFVPEEEVKKTMEQIQKILKHNEKIMGFETKRYAKDGTIKDVSVSSSMYRDHLGNPAGIVVILRDITLKKRLEEQFYATQRLEALETIAGGIAHNFNNLLMGIQGNASLMAFDLPKNSPLHKRISTIQELVKRGANLTNQLLGYARGGKYQPKVLDLNELVLKTTHLFKETRGDVRIIERISEGPLLVEGDESQLEQVMVNILLNAFQAMPDGGEIIVETSLFEVSDDIQRDFAVKSGKYAKLGIKDTGIGMEEEVKRRIFEPFFTTKPVNIGTGLGLSAAYGIIKNHGGFIDVASEKGKGSTFDVYLPLVEA